MKRLFFLTLILVSHYKIIAQNYIDYQKVQLPDSISAVTGEWIDADNNGLLDIVLFVTATSGKQYLMFVPGDTVTILTLSQKHVSLPHYDSYILHDYDNDNQLDFILAVNDNGNKRTILVRNVGDFNFAITDLTFPYFSFGKFVDLDQDAIPECVLSGESEDGSYFMNTFKNNNGTWTASADTLKAKLTAFECADFNKDGLEDIFMSGMIKPDSTFSAILEREKEFFIPNVKNQTLSSAFLCDIDTDGVLDVYALGSDQGAVRSHVFGRKSEYYITSKPAADLKNVFLADLDSDGLVDENSISISVSDTTNVILYKNGQQEVLNHKGLSSQKFGDLEHDGDLDLLQIVEQDEISLNILKNRLKNSAPSKPIALAIPVYDRILLFWFGVSDDHTPVNSITYDVFIEGGSAHQDAYFDLINNKRLAVKHGNNGTNNFRLLRNVDGNNFNYAIQSVDNSYHAGGICTGGGTPCIASVKEIIEVCSKEEFVMSAPSNAVWFSLTDGFLGESTSIEHNAGTQADTLFYIIPQQGGCPKVGVFEIKINNSPKAAPGEEKSICADVTTILDSNSNWKNVVWTSAEQGNLGNQSSLSYKSSVDDVITLEYSNEMGCTIRKEITIRISRPSVNVVPENSTIMKGQSVTLLATGAATYVWSPATGLSAANVPNPVASPGQDTQYTVTGYDSIGCTDVAIANIIVDASGYISTLFSPNGDGKNDLLKIYGLTTVQGFSLRIFNREGKLVYRTENLNEALTSGWDGTVNGVNQPNGVYFWKVSGASSQGRELTLNGQKEGSLVLLR